MTEPQLPVGALPKDWDDIDEERDRVLNYIQYVAITFEPDEAKVELERASARLIQLIYADWDAIRREDEETGVYSELEPRDAGDSATRDVGA